MEISKVLEKDVTVGFLNKSFNHYALPSLEKKNREDPPKKI